MNSLRLKRNLQILQLAEERKEELKQLIPLLGMIAVSHGVDWAINFADLNVQLNEGSTCVECQWNEYFRGEIYDSMYAAFPLDWMNMKTVPPEHAEFSSERQTKNERIKALMEKDERKEYERLAAKFKTT